MFIQDKFTRMQYRNVIMSKKRNQLSCMQHSIIMPHFIPTHISIIKLKKKKHSQSDNMLPLKIFLFTRQINWFVNNLMQKT